MSTHKIILSGFGGQGMLLMGQLIAHAGMLENKNVTWMPSYGPEMRGGTAHCTVIVSEKKIASPVITEATAVVAMNSPSFDKFQGVVSSGCHLFVNSSLIKESNLRDDIIKHNVDCSKLALEVGDNKVANMVMLGALVKITGVVSLSTVENVLAEFFTGPKEKMLPLNKHALSVWE